MVQKTTFFRFQAVLASKLAPTWVPKTGPKPTQNLTNRLQIFTKPTRRSQNGSEPRKTSKNMQKFPKMLPTWPHHGFQILTKSMQKASPGTDFLGTRKTSKHVQQSTTTIPLWLHHGTEGLPYGKVSSATSAVCQGCSQPASSNTMHSFVYALYAYGYCVTMETQETQHQSLSTEATQKSCEVIMQKRSCLCQLPVSLPIAAVQMTSWSYTFLYIAI